MAMREKLIELLRKTRYEYRRYIGMKDMEKRMAKTDEEFLAIDDSILGEIPFCADRLIANGVAIPVRCHECKHWKNEINGCTEDKRFCDIGFYMVHKDGFCSFGEKQTDNE